jgi:hypothetical protein
MTDTSRVAGTRRRSTSTHDRVDEARDRLRSATGTLRDIGATRWARRASEALDATA